MDKKLQTLNPNGYNLSCGGTSSYPDREKGNPNMSRIPWNKGLPRSEECKEKIRKTWTQDRKELYSKRFSGKNNPHYGKHPKGISRYGEDNPFFRKHHTPEVKAKIKQISQKFSKSIIRCDIQTEEELQTYISVHEAAEWVSKNTNFLNPDHSFISRCAKGRHKYAYGFKWKFAE